MLSFCIERQQLIICHNEFLKLSYFLFWREAVFPDQHSYCTFNAKPPSNMWWWWFFSPNVHYFTYFWASILNRCICGLRVCGGITLCSYVWLESRKTYLCIANSTFWIQTPPSVVSLGVKPQWRWGAWALLEWGSPRVATFQLCVLWEELQLFHL